ncbi:MAG: KpsF/GutQ family sugar-phosphate isomerase [Gammaproteobacteria bacterium]|nr:KpsF/GutQ family sugar-phosphate isomerase [Gammaproteobacteria bacterium]
MNADNDTSPVGALAIVRRVLQQEADAIRRTAANADVAYDAALALLLSRTGKVVVSGMGKSGLIARKIAATLSSTGTLAIFLHPAEAAHGDVGVVGEGDIFIAIGKSGESDELNLILPAIRERGARTIAITAAVDSTLARQADVVIDASVESEACPHGLAPTTSTTVALAIGDALAVALMELTGFQPEHFAMLHPGGALGRRLLLRVADVMIPINETAQLQLATATMKDVLFSLGKYGHGIVLFTDDDGRLQAMMTDGDVRRVLEKYQDEVFSVALADVVVRTPTTTESSVLAVQALETMEKRARPLNVLPVVDEGQCRGIVRLHDILRMV